MDKSKLKGFSDLKLKKFIFIEEYDVNKVIELKEGKKYGWFSFSELSELDIIEFDREILYKIFNQKLL